MTDAIPCLLDLPESPPAAGRVCRKCRVFKPWEEFYKAAGFRSGRDASCKSCQEVRRKRTRSDRKETGSGIRMRERMELIGATKRCPQCKRALPYSAFGIQQDRSDGTAWCCFDCRLIRYHRSIRWHLFQKAKQRAKDYGLPFSITVEDIVIPDVCPILGIPIETSNGKRRNASSPSLDRTIPALGYVPGNIAVMSWAANRLKGDCIDPEAFRRMADYIEHALKQR